VRYRLIPRLAALGLTMHWEVDETLQARELDPRDALNVQRIVQEALTNILKHARATEIRVSIQPVEGWLRVRIEDDGVGLEAMGRSTGKGLDNMRRRAQECRGRLDISPLERGARLDLLLPNA
jgi:signal transduction histidine kinase